MTTRVQGFLVTLDVNYREDDIEPLRAAMALFPGVVKVTNIPSHVETTLMALRVRRELREKIEDVLRDPE